MKNGRRLPDRRQHIISIVLGAAFVATGSPSPASAVDRPLAVVELFTSQGCSSCPPANANLIELSKRHDVLPLSFAVTYWDYLGWRDTFDDPKYTDRQASYEKPLGQQGPFTPQMVINGQSTVVGNQLDEIESALAEAKPLAGPPIALNSNSVEIGQAIQATPADVWVVRYDPSLVYVPVARGENQGKTLPHTHVVHDLQHLGVWSGATQSYPLSAEPAGLKTAVIVQAPNGGAILGAATD